MTADALMSRHTAAWQAATVHPFLEGVRDGSLPGHSFDRWLAGSLFRAIATASWRSCRHPGRPGHHRATPAKCHRDRQR
jgi:hypothetical protein